MKVHQLLAELLHISKMREEDLDLEVMIMDCSTGVTDCINGVHIAQIEGNESAGEILELGLPKGTKYYCFTKG